MLGNIFAEVHSWIGDGNDRSDPLSNVYGMFAFFFGGRGATEVASSDGGITMPEQNVQAVFTPTYNAGMNGPS